MRTGAQQCISAGDWTISAKARLLALLVSPAHVQNIITQSPASNP